MTTAGIWVWARRLPAAGPIAGRRVPSRFSHDSGVCTIATTAPRNLQGNQILLSRWRLCFGGIRGQTSRREATNFNLQSSTLTLSSPYPAVFSVQMAFWRGTGTPPQPTENETQRVQIRSASAGQNPLSQDRRNERQPT